MSEKLPKELKDIVDFIRSKSARLKINNWTDEEIAAYFLEKNKAHQVIALYKNQQPAGVIFFHLLSTYYMYIEQIWCEDKSILRTFLQILQDNFPTTTYLSFFHQRRKKPHTITVKNFIRIYGRS